MEDTMSSKAAYKVHKVFTLQAFVATFKSLVVFVSKEHLCFFVSLCFKKTYSTDSYEAVYRDFTLRNQRRNELFYTKSLKKAAKNLQIHRKCVPLQP